LHLMPLASPCLSSCLKFIGLRLNTKTAILFELFTPQLLGRLIVFNNLNNVTKFRIRFKCFRTKIKNNPTRLFGELCRNTDHSLRLLNTMRNKADWIKAPEQLIKFLLQGRIGTIQPDAFGLTQNLAA